MKRLLLLITICSPFISFAQVPIYTPTNGLVGWWGFNGNANDGSGNGNNGAVNGTVPFIQDRNGISLSAIQGGQGYITISTGFFNFGYNDAFTISLWFTQSTNSSGRIISTENPEGQFRISTYGSGINAIQFGNYLNYIYDTILDSQWHNYTFSYDNGTGIKYVDGISEGSFSLNNQELLNYGSPFTIGAKAAPAFDKWNGNIDDIGVWNRALTECEIKDLYEGSLGNCCTPNPIIAQPVDITVPINGSGIFSTSTSITSPTYQWQMDSGTGYMNLTNAGQFIGVDTDMLTISNVTLLQNNTLFRCIVSENSNCSDTTDFGVLTVEDNTGLGELNKDLFNVYPNPTTNSFTISSEKVINSEFKIIDAQGRKVLTGSMNGKEHTIDITKLSKGVYSVVFDNTELPVISAIKE